MNIKIMKFWERIQSKRTSSYTIWFAENSRKDKTIMAESKCVITGRLGDWRKLTKKFGGDRCILYHDNGGD